MAENNNNTGEREPAKNQSSPDSTEHTSTKDISRRTVLKAFAGIPVAGILGYEWFKKINYDKNKIAIDMHKDLCENKNVLLKRIIA